MPESNGSIKIRPYSGMARLSNQYHVTKIVGFLERREMKHFHIVTVSQNLSLPRLTCKSKVEATTIFTDTVNLFQNMTGAAITKATDTEATFFDGSTISIVPCQNQCSELVS